MEFTYTRTGRLETVTDGVGLRTFAYQENDKWRKETFDDPNSLFPGVQVKQKYSTLVIYYQGPNIQFGTLPKLGRIMVGTAADPDADYKTTYTYNQGADHMIRVEGPGLPNNGANYEYLADSHLLWRTKFKQGPSVQARTVRVYEDSRDLLERVRNKWGTATRSFYQYANDELGRREWVYRDGTAFSGDHADVWGYNARNELRLSERYDTFDPNDPNNPSDNVPGLDREYVYDPIGNRDWSKTGTDPNTAYATNNLNQYTATTDPNESFTYDDDGNLTEVGGIGVSPVSYTWDAENRLTCVAPASSPVNGDKKVEFIYDYMGRRIEKKVSTHNGSSWSVTDTRRFVWSDWLVVLEFDATDPNDVTVLRKYTWGLESDRRTGELSAAMAIGFPSLFCVLVICHVLYSTPAEAGHACWPNPVAAISHFAETPSYSMIADCQPTRSS